MDVGLSEDQLRDQVGRVHMSVLSSAQFIILNFEILLSFIVYSHFPIIIQ